MVDDSDEILLINSEGTIIRIEAKEISRLGRATQGVKIMRTGEDVEIISMAKMIREEEHEMDSRLAQLQRALRKAERAKEKAEAEFAKKEEEEDDSEQTSLDI